MLARLALVFISLIFSSLVAQNLTGQFTIGAPVPGYENITSQPQLNVETVHKLLDDREYRDA